MNKLVYADMPINMAISLLNNVCGIEKVNVLSFDFGLSHLRNLVSNIDFVSGDEVFLTNVPFAVQLVKDDMLEEVDGFSFFINSFYILDTYGNLKLAKTLTDRELRPAHNFERLIVNDAFDKEAQLDNIEPEYTILRSGSRVKVKSEQIALGIKSPVYTVVGDWEIDSPNRRVCFEDEYGYKRVLRYSDLYVWEFNE